MSFIGPLDGSDGADGLDGGLASGTTIDHNSQDSSLRDWTADGGAGPVWWPKTGRPDGQDGGLAQPPGYNQDITVGYGSDALYNTSASENPLYNGGPVDGQAFQRTTAASEPAGFNLRGYVLNEPTPGMPTVDASAGRITSVSKNTKQAPK